jgi:hypothetical protein
MKYTFLIIALLSVFLLLGCPPTENDVYHVYYFANGATEGSVPTDSREYNAGDTAVVLGQGSLKNDDYDFLGWRYNNRFYFEGEKITVNWSDINLYAAWDDGTDSPFSYKIENGEVTITDYKERYNYSVTIPETLVSKPVTAINDMVFSSLGISKLNLSKNLKEIGIACFSSNNIDQLVIPNNVNSIGMGAFRNNKLTRITFGSGITVINSNTFSTNKLTEITIPANIKTIAEGAFDSNDITLIKIGAGVTIEGNTSLGTYGAIFKTYYNGQSQQAGTYIYTAGNNTWARH